MKEVEEAVFVGRIAAAPGVDGITAPLLNFSGTMLKWLHKHIVLVGDSGKAPIV